MDEEGELCEPNTFFSGFIFCWWNRIPRWQLHIILVAVACTVVACCITVIHMCRHQYTKTQPALKRITMVMLGMVPIYSIASCFALIDARSRYRLATLVNVFRDFYEAVVIVAFLQLIFIALGGPEEIYRQFARSMQKPETPFLRCIPTPFSPGLRYVEMILFGILQFAVVMILVTFVGALIWAMTDFSPAPLTSSTSIASALKTLSVSFAMYNLTIFYFEIGRNDSLRGKFERVKNAEAKFFAVKLIIMFTMMQEFLCEVLTKFDFFDGFHLVGPHADGVAKPEEFGMAIQSFTLCIEMVVFAVIHCFAYPVGEFSASAIEADKSQLGLCRLYKDMRCMSSRAARQRQMLTEWARGNSPDFVLWEVFRAFDLDDDGRLSGAEFDYLIDYLIESSGMSGYDGDALKNKKDTLTGKDFFDWNDFKLAFSDDAKAGTRNVELGYSDAASQPLLSESLPYLGFCS